MLCWSLWCFRNELVWQNKQSQPAMIFSRARSVLQKWKMAKVSSNRLQFGSISAVEVVSWQKLVFGSFKCNVEVAMLNNGSYGLGIIVRDANGLCCAGKLMVIPGMADPQLGEALSFREALSWAKNFNFFSFCIEIDCQVIIMDIHSSASLSSYFGLVINDCKALLQELPLVSFHFVKKPTNQVVHTIAIVIPG